MLEDAKREAEAGRGTGVEEGTEEGGEGEGGRGGSEDAAAEKAKERKKKSNKKKRGLAWSKRATNLWVYVKGEFFFFLLVLRGSGDVACVSCDIKEVDGLPFV